MFKAVDSRVDIQSIETEILDFWRKRRVFERTMEERTDKPRFVTYEGPPTANGKPGVHHALARAFKDIFPRYKTMRGYYVLRKGGWDTHGLPIEIAMEKELGLADKREIEDYGIAAFNKKCRESVFRNILDWEKFTERMAYWTDLDNAYVTLTNDYIESVWWVLQQLFEKGLLFRDYKVVPYAADSGTPLSSHEVSLGYKTVMDPSVFVRFPVKDQPGLYFLAWTTTPWTLPGNAGLAVGPDIDYVQVEGPAEDGEGTEQLILAAERMAYALKDAEQYTVVKRMKGRDLLGMHYNPLYTFIPVEQDYAFVIAGDFVSTEDGTGIVHIAPAFGADDMIVGREHNLPVLMTVNDGGKFIDAVTPFRGLWFKDADKQIIRDLRNRGLMYRSEQYEHSYPHSWRTGMPLMYVARETWYIRTTALKDRLVALNQTINWVPGHIRDGRFGNWLDDLKDWALGRERYWATPLPIWVDDQTGEMICVGSRAQLSDLTGRDLSELELHRPHVDEITFPNPNGGGGMMRRVPEVIDVWFDSGAMPVAQWGYPVNNQAAFADQFPADYICEAIDQTRGWFYTLHAISSMVFDSVAYKNVICLGHILDEKGEKMSKSKGNVIDPWEVMNEHGADAMRWYMYTAGPPGESRRFSVDLVGEVIRKFYSTLWNTYSFFTTYASVDGWTPQMVAPPVAERDALDRWVLAELSQLVQQVTTAYDNYDVPGATRPVQAFVEVLSNWYVRLSRSRFWGTALDDDKRAAYATLYDCLLTVSKLIAPAMPMLADKLYRDLVLPADPKAPESVHLADWPEFNEAVRDLPRIEQMRVVQRLVSLGRAARESVGIGVRQPLAKAQFLTRSASEAEAVAALSALITGELNVKAVESLDSAEGLVSYALNPLPQLLGKKFGKDFPKVQKALREGSAENVIAWAQALLKGENVILTLGGTDYEVTPEEVEVKRSAAEGYAVAEEAGYLAALDVTLSQDLLREGLAREVIRRVQITRKDAGFEINDRIHIVYEASETLAAAIVQFADYIQAETLAESVAAGETNGDYIRAEFLPSEDPKQDTSVKGERLILGVQKVNADA